MSAKRLAARIGHSQRLSICRLPDYQLRFHKMGKDGSGKCDAWHSNKPDQEVFGVLYSIAQQQIKRLDRFENEGQGYLRKTVHVFCAKGKKYNAQVYLAALIDPSLKPFHWYKQHVIAGAMEAGLAEHYIQSIANITAIADHDAARSCRELSIYSTANKHFIHT